MCSPCVNSGPIVHVKVSFTDSQTGLCFGMPRPLPLAQAGSFDSESSRDGSPGGEHHTEAAVRAVLNSKRPCFHSPVCIALQLLLLGIVVIVLALPALLAICFVRLIPSTPLPASLPHSIHTVIRGRRWAERAKRRVSVRMSARAAEEVRARRKHARQQQIELLAMQPPAPHQARELPTAEEEDHDLSAVRVRAGGGSSSDDTDEFADLESGRGLGSGRVRPPETTNPACDWSSLHAGLCWLTGPHEASRPSVVYVRTISRSKDLYQSLYLCRCRCRYLYLCLNLSLDRLKDTSNSIYLSICLSIYMSFFLSVYLYVYLSIHLSIYLPIYLSVCLSPQVPGLTRERGMHTQG